MDINQIAKEIRQLTREKKYADVVKLANRINLSRITSGIMVLDIVEAYENVGDRRSACRTLYSYYETHGITGRNMMQKLIELCVEVGEIPTAVDLCLQYENDWPDSRVSYLMRYQITSAAEGSLEEQIYYLEQFKAAEFDERWAYELAKLYDKNNEREKCAKTCHDIICFFGHGKYVEKAARLKSRTVGLTDDEEKVIAEAITKAAEEKAAKDAALKKAKEEAAAKAAEEAKESNPAPSADANIPSTEELPSTDKDTEAPAVMNVIPGSQELGGWEADKARLRRESYADDSMVYPEEAELPAEEEPVPETAEDLVKKAESAKLQEIEEAARRRREQREAQAAATAEMVSQVTSGTATDRYSEVEKYSEKEIHFTSITREEKDDAEALEKAGRGGIFQTFGRIAKSLKTNSKAEKADDYEEEDEEPTYVVVGRNSEEYLEDIENRILSELDMVDESQIENLSREQIKELYELKIHRKLREMVAKMIEEDPLFDHSEDENAQEFVEKDPFATSFEEVLDADFEVAEDEQDPEAEEVEESEAGEAAADASAKIQVIGKAEEEMPAVMVVEAEEIVSDLAETVEGAESHEGSGETEVSEASMENKASAPSTIPENSENPENPETESAGEAEGGSDSEHTIAEQTVEQTAEKAPEPAIFGEIADHDADLPFETFSDCVVAYAKKEGYLIEETAMMTIAVLAEDMQAENTPLSVNNAKKLAAAAIERSKKKSFTDKLFGKYSKKYAMTLRDRHFDWKG